MIHFSPGREFDVEDTSISVSASVACPMSSDVQNDLFGLFGTIFHPWSLEYFRPAFQVAQDASAGSSWRPGHGPGHGTCFEDVSKCFECCGYSEASCYFYFNMFHACAQFLAMIVIEYSSVVTLVTSVTCLCTGVSERRRMRKASDRGDRCNS